MTITKRKIPTSNYDTSRKPIDRVVIHWFGIGTLAGADARFSKQDEQASAHYGISDTTVYQWVDEAHTAYHAGNYTMNQRSIGIEHDATTTKDASDKTYQTSGELVREICRRHNIPLDRKHIIGHREVSATQCPGTIDIDKIILIAKGEDKMQEKIDALEKALDEMRDSRNKWKAETAELKLKVKELEGNYEKSQKETSDAKAELQKIKEALGNNKTPLSEYRIRDFISEVIRRIKN